MKLLLSGPLAAVLMVCLTSAALAGGWAVTTLDALPQAIRAGETYQLGYVIRQHGVTPFTSAKPEIRISGPNGELLRFPGVPEGAPGHYVSTVSFPSDGLWTWRVDQNPFEPQQLGALTVQSPAPAAAPIPALKAQPPVELAMVALVALLLGLVASVLTQARRGTAAPSRS